MNELIKIGKIRTILISISIIYISIYTIYLYQIVKPEIDVKKLIQQFIRLLLTLGLLVATYKGKNWAKITSSILFSVAAIIASIEIFASPGTFITKAPFIVMFVIYSLAIYHFWFSESYKAFFNYQNDEKSKKQ